MKILKKSLFLSLVTALVGIAGAELKVATVDVQKVFKDYYKTHEAQKEMDAMRQDVYSDVNKRVERIQAIEKAIGEIKKQIEDPATSDATKQQLHQDFNEKSNEGVSLDKERREFLERKNQVLGQEMKKKLTDIIAEIRKATEDEARKSNFDLVFDKSGLAVSQTPLVMFAKDEMEITASVIKVLNANAPEGFDPEKAPTPTVPVPVAGETPAPAVAN